MRYWVFAIILLLGAQPLMAQPTRYVSDELEIDLRSGPTLQHRIQRFISSGTALQELESADGWSRVRLRNGEEGWVLTRYLANNPSARERLERLTASAGKARDEATELREQLAGESKRLQAALAQVAQLTTDNEQIKQQLSDAERGLALFDENRELKKNIVDLRREIQDRDAEIGRLSDRSQQEWFMVGAAVLGAGMLVGIVVPRIRWRKRSGWDRL